jgi:hypothetical protein
VSIGGAESGQFVVHALQRGTSHTKHGILTIVTQFVHRYRHNLHYAGANIVVSPCIL